MGYGGIVDVKTGDVSRTPKLIRLIRIIKFVRFLRLLRLLKLKRLLYRIEEIFTGEVLSYIFGIIRLLSIIMFIAH